MADVQTVLGPVPHTGLGPTTMHEHVLVDGSFRNREEACRSPAWHEPVGLCTHAALRSDLSLHRDNLILTADHMERELRLLAESGTRTLLDVTAVGLRGELAALPDLSRRTGLHIVASTGFYKRSSWPAGIRDWSAQRLRQHMRTEIDEAVTGTDFRAGHVKCGLGDLGEDDERCLRACATVAAERGLSLTVHPSFSDPAGPARIVRIAADAGLAPDRVVVAHCDGFMVELSLRRLVTDPSSWGLRLDQLREVLGLGATASVDCFGHAWSDERRGQLVEADWQRLAGLYRLLQEGYAGQLVLGCDVARKMLTRRYGGHGYTRVNDWVLPTLRDLGVPEGQIEQLTVANPARILGRR